MSCVEVLLICSYVGLAISKSASLNPWQQGQVVNLYLNESYTGGDEKLRKIAENQLYRIEYSEEKPPKNCSLTFEAEAVDACTGVCYLFVPNAFIKQGKDVAQLKIRTGDGLETYNSANPVRGGPHCTTERTMTLTFTLSQNYTFNLKSRTFHFTLEVYNKCGVKGKVKNVKYEEAIKHLSGYHTEEEFVAQQRTNFIQGVLAGFGIASVFLLVFVIACCYIRTHEHGRTPTKNVVKGQSDKLMLKRMTAGQRK